MWNYNNPYGYPAQNYPQQPFAPYSQPQMQSYGQAQAQPQAVKVNTNKIFVNGIEGAKVLQLPNNSCVLACDNDLDVVYEISVDGTGKRTIQTFDISEHKEAPQPSYVTKEEFSGFKSEIEELVKGMKKEAE